MAQIRIMLTEEEHQAIHAWFRARGFRYGPVGRAKWGILTPRQQQAMIIRSLRAIGKSPSLIRAVIADAMTGARAGHLIKRVGPKGKIICGAIGGAILIIISSPGVLQAETYNPNQHFGECKCAEFKYISTVPNWWNLRTWSNELAGPPTRITPWLSFGEMLSGECSEMENFDEVVSTQNVLGYTIREIVYTKCESTPIEPPADASRPSNG